MSLAPNFVNGQRLFNAFDLAGDSTVSDPIDIREATGYSAQISWAGVAGTGADLLIEASNDSIVWTTVSNTGIDSASGNALFEEDRAMYAYVRASLVIGSVTAGTLNVAMCVKRI